MKYITVIGAGLAGCEAAYQIAKRGINVKLFEAKPKTKSAAHISNNLCELVCSNSLKSEDLSTASGLLKAELKALDSLVLSCAYEARVPSGGALAVERDKFSEIVTKSIQSFHNIELIYELRDSWDENFLTVLATGPLTLGGISDRIASKFSGNLYFYDAAAPIVDAQSIDYSSAFWGGRYGKGGDDYLNCPMTKDEYSAFYNALINAECVLAREFEKKDVFEGCMAVEVMAKRGVDTLRFGPLRPVGFIDPATDKRPYVLVQLRKENLSGTMFNIVGFQTNLKFGEQKRVFSLIPALKNAEFLRYGVMHRNTYINAPEILDKHFRCKNSPNTFIAGQLSGVEGYVESIASGLMAGINAAKIFLGGQSVSYPEQTILGALSAHISAPSVNFQPMNANFGILPPPEHTIRDKAARKLYYGERSLKALNEILPLI